MEPTIKELNVTKDLLNKVTLDGKDLTQVNIKRLILRPVLQRIVFITQEFDRIIIYEGATDYEAHKADSDDTLINMLLSTIDTKYKV